MISNMPRTPAKSSGFSKIFDKFRIDNTDIPDFGVSAQLNKLPLDKVAWVTFLVISYIFFQHNIESLTRNLEKAEIQMKEMRATFISHKSKYMFNSKHSEVSKKLTVRGMDKNIEPPIKVIVED